MQHLAREGLFHSDVSHTVNHLSFGEDKDIKIIKAAFGTGELNPLDNNNKKDSHSRLIEYYMKVYILYYI